MNTIQGIQYIVNASPDHGKGPAFLSLAETAAVQVFHEALPEYAPTALVPLPELAESLGIKAAFIKDESTRFGLKAFKGLGGSYAIFRAVCDTSCKWYERRVRSSFLWKGKTCVLSMQRL